jgi:hypothetical protein
LIFLEFLVDRDYPSFPRLLFLRRMIPRNCRRFYKISKVKIIKTDMPLLFLIKTYTAKSGMANVSSFGSGKEMLK